MKFAGQAYFRGNERIDESEVLKETDFKDYDEGNNQEPIEQGDKQNEPKIEQAREPINDVNELIKGIKRMGVTNFQMISANKETR